MKKEPLPEYVVPCQETALDRGVYPFETVPIEGEETYSLDHTMARFILPRLKRYREDIEGGVTWGVFSGKPDGHVKTLAAVDEMIAAFQVMASDDYWTDKYKPEVQKVIHKGLQSFAKHYQSLWF